MVDQIVDAFAYWVAGLGVGVCVTIWALESGNRKGRKQAAHDRVARAHERNGGVA